MAEKLTAAYDFEACSLLNDVPKRNF